MHNVKIINIVDDQNINLCTKCDGQGKILEGKEQYVCARCKGSGKVITFKIITKFEFPFEKFQLPG